MRKRIFSMLVAICMLLGMMPVTVQAADGTGDFTVAGGALNADYTYSANILTIKTGTALTISGTTIKDRILVSSGVPANITLSGVSITLAGNLSPIELKAAAYPNTAAEVNLTLAAGPANTLKTTNPVPALLVPSGTTLTIGGTGSIEATNSMGYDAKGAGIGGGSFLCGTIIINSGTVVANGTLNAPGIGGSLGTVTINGGHVTATGGIGNTTAVTGGAGIDATTISIKDSTVTAKNDGMGAGISGETISINNSTVTATGGTGGAGIGKDGNGGNVTIIDSTVVATGGNGGAGIGGAGIGGTSGYSFNNIIIKNSNVTATGGANGAGIGAGFQGSVGDITIDGGIITAKGGTDACGIGAGNTNVSAGFNNITINSGTVTATGDGNGSGIGAGKSGAPAGTITVNGGYIIATGGTWGAGIGDGNVNNSDGGANTVNGGTVEATGGADVDIGLSEGGSSYNVIRGGTVKAARVYDSPQNDNVAVYLAKILDQANVTSVFVDGVDYKISQNHKDDNTLYLYMLGKDHTIIVKRADGKDYMYKVTFADAAFTVTEVQSSTISPITANFNTSSEATGYADVAVTQALNGNTLTAIKNSNTALTEAVDYTVSGTTITIKKEYLAQQAVGDTILTFDYSDGVDPTLTVTVSVSTPPALTGTVTISGTAKYGQTLAAVVADSNSSALTYQWKCNNTDTVSDVGTGNTYVIGEADIGKTIICEVTSPTTHTGAITSNATNVIAKADAPATPDVTFTLSDGTDQNKLKGSTDLMECSLDGGSNWTACASDMDLTSVLSNITVAHGIKIRVKATATVADGVVKSIAITKAVTPTLTPTQPTTINGTGSIADLNTDTAYQYSVDNGANWLDVIAGSTTMSGLAPGTYLVRVKATGTVLASENQSIALAEYVPSPLTGTVTISGTAKYGQTLAAVVADSNGSALTYQWKRNYTDTVSDVGKGNTYVIGEADIEETIICEVTSPTTHTGAITSAPTGVIGKADGSATLTAPSINYVTEKLATLITLEYEVGDSGIWKPCTVSMLAAAFGWNGNSALGVNFRIPATASQEGSAAVTVSIPKRPATPLAADFTIGKPSASGSNGTLDGITDKMEYKTGTATTYTGGTGAELTGITDGTKYTIRIKATASAFASKTVPVTVASKLSATVSFANATVSYNGVAQLHENATVTEADGIMTYAYTAAVGSELTDGKPQNAGSYEVTANYESNTHIGSAIATLTISKVDLTITANNITFEAGEFSGEYTATVAGLVGVETISAVSFDDGLLSHDNRGIYAITPKRGTISGGGNGNYNISYVAGTLTITLSTEVIDTALASANTAKSGVVTSDGEPSSVANGTKFVKIAEMKALTDAIAAATEAKDTVLIATEAQAAAAALDEAVATFNPVIKTGTYVYDGDDDLPIVTPPTPPTKPGHVEIEVDVVVGTDGNLTVNVKDKDITDAIAKAKDTENGITIVINVSGSETASGVNVNLPKVVQETVINNKIVNTIVVVDNPNIRIGMDLSTIKEINAQAKADVNLTATRMDSSKLTGNAKTAIGTRPAFSLKANYGEGKQVENFGTGNVSITIPYTLGADEKTENVCAVYVDAKGNVQWLSGSTYDSTTKLLHFTTNHFSTYGVGYRTSTSEFTDIANHWAKNDIDFVVSHGLFEGTSATTFSPNMEITRGMFVTVLGRLSGIDSTKYENTKFADVSTTAYYAPFVAWATEKYITRGTSDTTFAPDQIITRQEAAVFMESYAKAMKHNVAKLHDEITFTDYATIAIWAMEAVKSMQSAGIIIGKGGNLFDPTATTTRAEASTILRRYIELIINTQAVVR